MDIISDCVTFHDLEVFSTDVTGRNIYMNAPIVVTWDDINARWVVSYNGSNYWYSYVASSPDPSIDPNDWVNASATCSSLSLVKVNSSEICDNGLDDDNDGLTDCDDPDCQVSTFNYTNYQANYLAGQPNFLTNTAGLSDSHYDGISDIALDPVSKKVFVSDTWNHRILRYASVEAFINNEPAESVLGQSNFTSNVQASGASGMASPKGICVDNQGTLWVADYNNSRVVKFNDAANKPAGAWADGVLGKSGFYLIGNAGGMNGMANPSEVLVDDSGTLWVSDYTNRRILRFDNANSKANGAYADGVLGKPDFTTYSGTLSRSVTGEVMGMTFIGNSLFVSDFGGHRITRWDNPSLKPNGADMDAVIGQPNFTNSTFGISSMMLNRPYMIDSDDNGGLYVCDKENNRVLLFKDALNAEFLEPADFVYGQPNFNSNTLGTQAHELNRPRSVTILDLGYTNVMSISDYSNNRMVGWGYNNITNELTEYSNYLPGYDENGGTVSFVLNSTDVGNVYISNSTTGSYTYYPPGICPLNNDSIIQINYSISNDNSCTVSDNVLIKVKDVDPCNFNQNEGGCNELYSVDWYDGSGAGLQWAISNGEATLTSNMTIGGSQGDLIVDVTLDNQDGQNIDFSNCGVGSSHIYTATCNDPNASFDCDGNIFTSDSQTSLGCSNLTMGKTSANSNQQITLKLDFNHPVRIMDLKVIDLDYWGSILLPYSSWQDEVKISADNNGIPVKVQVVGGANVVVSNNNTPEVTAASIYNILLFGDLNYTNPDGHVTISTNELVTSISISYSNGPDDDGLSNGQGIALTSFNVCPSFEENTLALCSDGMDNDMDGAYDCNDIDCSGISACADFDGDGLSDVFDKDDDNDGLQDIQESTDQANWNYFAYYFNTPVGTMTSDYADPEITSWFTTSISDLQANNLIVSTPSSSLQIDALPSVNFEQAYTNQEYLSFQFSTGWDLHDGIINRISCGLYGGMLGDSYHLAILISQDGFATNSILSSDVFLKTIDGMNIDFSLFDSGYRLNSGTTYDVRVYLYGQVDDSPYSFVALDDVAIAVSGFLGNDFDGDGYYSHIDMDSDNDGIYDVIEGGGTDNDNNGEIGIGVIMDGNGNGWSAICDPEEGGVVLPDRNSDAVGNPDRITYDSDGDGCNDVSEAGYPDSNNDGVLGGVPLATDTKGKVIYTP